MIERGGKLDAAARDIRVLGLRRDRRQRRDLLRSLAHRHAVGSHEAGRDRGLRPRPALKQAARDQQAIGAFSGGHGVVITFPGRSAARSMAKLVRC